MVACGLVCAAIEGWIVAVTNVHDETQEDDIYELFAEHGDIKQIVLNLDRRTGYVKVLPATDAAGLRSSPPAVTDANLRFACCGACCVRSA